MSHSNKKIVIIGAGPCGLSAAYYASKDGYQVTLIEKNDFAGGKGGSRRWKDYTVDFGPHVFHGMSKEFTELMLEYGEGELGDVTIKQKLYVTENPMSYPLNMKEAFRVFSLGLQLKVGIDFLIVKIKSLFRKPSLDSFKSWGIAHYGKTLYNLCFGFFSERVWGVSADQLSAEFAKRKLPNLSLWGILVELVTKRKIKKGDDKSYLNIRRFLYHKKGSGHVYQNIARAIEEQGGKIIYSADIKNISLNGNGKVASLTLNKPQEETIECDYLMSSAPLVDLVGYFAPQNDRLNTLRDSLPFRNGVVVNVVVNKEKCSDAHWIYLVNNRFKFSRLSEPKNLSASLTPEGKTLIMLERICSPEDKEWSWSADDWKETVIKELAFFDIKGGDIEEIFLSKMDKAFPLYLVGYEKKRTEFLDELAKIKNLVSTGRYGLYLDIDMHDSMVLGKEGLNHLVNQKVPEFYSNHDKLYLNARN